MFLQLLLDGIRRDASEILKIFYISYNLFLPDLSEFQKESKFCVFLLLLLNEIFNSQINYYHDKQMKVIYICTVKMLNTAADKPRPGEQLPIRLSYVTLHIYKSQKLQNRKTHYLLESVE